jgi:hypothetical protein
VRHSVDLGAPIVRCAETVVHPVNHVAVGLEVPEKCPNGMSEGNFMGLVTERLLPIFKEREGDPPTSFPLFLLLQACLISGSQAILTCPL